MSKNFALRSAAALTTLFIVGCSTDKPALESIAGVDLQQPRLNTIDTDQTRRTSFRRIHGSRTSR